MSTPEGRVKKMGRQICKQLNIYNIAIQQGYLGRGGIPDDALCVMGKFVHIEYKANMPFPDIKDIKCRTHLLAYPTPQQCLRMDECRSSGGITLVIDKNNLVYLMDALKYIITNDIKYLESFNRCNWLFTHTDLQKLRVLYDA